MSKLYYCVNCKRVFNNTNICNFCNSKCIKQIKVGNHVNIIGTELKGVILQIKGINARLLIKDKFNKKYIKTYSPDKLKKIS